ncbi:hypothetical protein Leryth_017160 [Lithospermum erythrorhizon]|nr:hypothetical protein Leryth_017160 [Lithospermum erythrorhizon]
MTSQDASERKFNAANNEKLCNDSSDDSSQKKPRAPTNKNKRDNVVKAKKNMQILEDNIISNTNEYKNESTLNAEKQIRNPCSSMSEDDSNNVSLESNVGVTTSECKDSSVHDSKGKTRATRGNATDPQSLYARKRRERINERLRILQTLIPNGTKVDISTMLEEAVQYVKFMQLQNSVIELG